MVALIVLVLLVIGLVAIFTARDIQGVGMAMIPLGMSLVLALSI